MQRPKQRHRHDQKHEIDQNVAETENNFHRRGRYRTPCGRKKTHSIVKGSGYWPAGEDDEENTNEGPKSHKDANCPGRVAEFRDNSENPIEKYQDGEFGKGDGDDVE